MIFMKKIEIAKEFLKQCIEKRYTYDQVANLLGCSTTVVLQVARSYGLSFKNSKRLNEKYKDTRNQIWYAYQSNAKRAKREFSLTEEEFFKIIQQPCTYCGRQYTNVCEVKDYWSMSKEREVFKYTGIDRVDSSKGYTFENSVPCCEQCNRGKRDLSEFEFREWIKALVHFNYNKIS